MKKKISLMLVACLLLTLNCSTLYAKDSEIDIWGAVTVAELCEVFPEYESIFTSENSYENVELAKNS